MRIVFDARCFFEIKTGVGYYAYNLIKHLLDIDEKNNYTLFYGVALRPSKEPLPDFSKKGVDTILIKYPGRIFDLVIDRFPSFRVDFLIGKYDVFHTPHFTPPPLRGKTIITVHDLVYCLYPQFFPDSMIRPLLRHLSRAAREAKRIIAISENTKKDLVEVLGVEPEKIVVTYLAASELFRPIDDEERISIARKKYGIDSEYIGFFGTIEPRKNVATLVKAYADLKRRNSLSYKLVLVGQKGWKYQDVFDTIASLRLEEDVVFTEYVAEEDLPLLVNGAEVVVYPSLYEGFGLPPLEAMACGTPVITSNTSSLPEVVGDAALMVDPQSVEELSLAMERVLSDISLKEEMIHKGLERAKMFSWEKVAKETIKVYEDVCRCG